MGDVPHGGRSDDRGELTGQDARNARRVARAAAAAAPARPTTRFAPSPTGRLHLGHVANAVWTWGMAHAAGGRVLLRVEDHDRGRSRPEHERRIYEDLEWLGLEPDRESLDSLLRGASPFRQSDNDGVYREALESLARLGLVYGCRCSRRVIARTHGLADAPPDRELPYPGTCRERGIEPGPGVGVRLRLPPDVVAFHDLRHGAVRHRPADQCGDLLLRDAAGNWTYQFAVTVDDLRHRVDLVVRGDDLLASTGRQILLGSMLGRSQPARYLHHPLIRGPAPGSKLSKRDGAEGLDAMRASGRRADEILGLAAWRTGLLERPEPVAPRELSRLFERG